ncbi:hypothetical protein E2986_11672 [Frieseomelitta varia]|uniref:Uncharacterized protein n=1 Tax=Frieseomelitta varia TaxID=561572 RepID=A0A833VRX1_9HYME|nr:hypothetical protein E2986_11672 [Frieseomelitta varia]
MYYTNFRVKEVEALMSSFLRKENRIVSAKSNGAEEHKEHISAAPANADKAAYRRTYKTVFGKRSEAFDSKLFCDAKLQLETKGKKFQANVMYIAQTF